MSSLAIVPRGHTEPSNVELPEECPRCGESLEGALREVNLVVTLDDGAEIEVVGHECAGCGWCCGPEI
jgi:hypothetical protein